ncbi:lactonase family protein [Sphingomonas jatrophae]|uniref:6-phosphogluconolactonase, cycloisomerase 2 family n=1 Tax=Sphingomonas jatrophae TaxID=1166337 RepID=A0A1I6JTC2_9SPHN|nr:beta-propeller fold lactonase family protein [Sphingomonas jatrophae]SFR82255.1 6-phosphogluconolactonase, cycloisomerase 2 family [Sphingomonas jatrophae]
MAEGGCALLVGTYDRLGGSGVVPLTLTADDRLIVGEPMSQARNASWWVPAGDLILAVDEQDQGEIAAFATADWEPRFRRSSGGAAPCHLAFDPATRKLAVANYESGSVTLFRLDEAGRPTRLGMALLTGHGPHAERQAGPHAHWVGFADSGRRLHLVDLGADRILSFTVDPERGLGQPATAWHAPAGSGPRHLAFLPGTDLAVLASELASTLTMLRRTGPDGYEAVQTLTSLPPDAGESLIGAILTTEAGDRIHVSNRGHDSIATFALEGGQLRLLGHVPSGGAMPRHLLLLKERARLLAANEEGGGVTLFAVGPDGTLRSLPARADIAGPVFLDRA